MAVWWTKRSLPPSSGVMKPKPLSLLNHLTVPVAILPSTGVRCCVRGGGYLRATDCGAALLCAAMYIRTSGRRPPALVGSTDDHDGSRHNRPRTGRGAHDGT